MGSGGIMRLKSFFTGVALLALAGCNSLNLADFPQAGLTDYAALYSALPEEQFPIDGLNVARIPDENRRVLVDYETDEKRGTLVINTQDKFLYLVLGQDKALRYRVGVGRLGYSWSGRAKVGWKREWPTWTPTKEMIQRRPALKRYEDGMDPGLTNPLGARALYLLENGVDNYYRIHGTNKPASIGTAASSGCIRLYNHDIIDLYERVKPNADVVVVHS